MATHKTQSPVPGSLEAVLASAAKQPALRTQEMEDGHLLSVELELLDDNPFQPRTAIDEAKLEELASSIRQNGLLQPVAVRPSASGRFFIVAGHRRVTAFRRLRDAASDAGERRRWSAVPAQVMLALDDSRMAVSAYVENVQRADLNPAEEAAALARIKDMSNLKTAKELAQLTSQNTRRVERLLQLHKAPDFIREAVTNGVLVTTEDGKDRRERRELDLMTTLAFMRLYEHYFQLKPAKAEERVDAVIRRALVEGWGKRRIEEYVESAIAGRVSEPEPAAAGAGKAVTAALFEQSPQRFVIHVPRLSAATPDQKQGLRAALEALLGGTPTSAGAMAGRASVTSGAD